MSAALGTAVAEPTLSDLAVMIGGVQDQLTGVIRRIDGIDSRLDGIDSRLDGIDSRLDGMDRKFDQVFDILGSHEERFRGIEQRLGKVEDSIEELRDEVRAGMRAIDLDAVRLIDHERRIGALEHSRA